MAFGAVLFVLGFTAVFVTAGVLFGTLGSAVAEHRLLIERILGAVTIVLGFAFLGQIPFLQREFRIHRLPRAGLVGAPLLGVVFGLAWTPCLTPTLTAVANLALSQGTAGRGALLSLFYCLGLGVPFVLVALGFGWMESTVGFMRRHARAVSRVGGVLLIAMGVLLVTGLWDHWMASLQGWVGQNTGVGADL